MVVDYPLAYDAVELVLKNREGRNTVTSSLRCGIITGVTTLGACVFLGPVGVFAGAAIGSTVAYATHRGQFKPLWQVFEEDMSEEDRKELLEIVHEFVSKLTITDALSVITLLRGDQNLALELFHIVRNVISNWQERQKQKSRRTH